MLEPKTCKYILTIESPSLCELINGPIDDYGIFLLNQQVDNNEENNSDSLKTNFVDKTDQYFERYEEEKYKLSSVEHEIEVSDDKKKKSKIEL